MKRRISRCLMAVVICGVLTGGTQQLARVDAQTQRSDCRTFEETGVKVCGAFLQYWEQHGGLAQQGLPIADIVGEPSPIDGKVRTVQYFERAEFEYHFDSQPPDNVQLSLLGA